MIRLSGEGACSTRPVVRSANWTGLLSANPSSVAPPAMTRLKDVTTASRTMFQFSSRILMRGKRGRGVLVPVSKVKGGGTARQCGALRNKKRALNDDLRSRTGNAADDWVQ